MSRMAVEYHKGQWTRVIRTEVSPPTSFWAADVARYLPWHDLLHRASFTTNVLPRDRAALTLLEQAGYLTTRVATSHLGYGSPAHITYAELTSMGRALLDCLNALHSSEQS